MSRADAVGSWHAPLRRGAARALTTTSAAVALLVTGCASPDKPVYSAPQAPPGQNAAQGQNPSEGSTSGSGSAPGTPDGGLARSAPVRVTIPSLSVSSALETLRQRKDGAMETPKDPDLAGWYEPGPTPGSLGPAVIAGHVTWNGAAAVFEKLKTMKTGDTIEVARKDGKTATFAVDRVAEYPKAAFPTLEVYKNLDYPGLRLVTCGGDFDADRHYYPNNVVVFARMTSAG
ncbi:class F sortase [Streptomyces sp. NPDC006879]|uniref:class F sortase n=1 Tax=Streptomyces sp. NPDC006879 TaxID=3364767 RepID=UPI003689C112